MVRPRASCEPEPAPRAPRPRNLRRAGRRKRSKARALRLRRSRLSCRLHAFRLCQSRRAEGRHILSGRLGRSHDFQQSKQLHPQGRRGAGVGLLFDSLMTPAADEPDAVYGLVAESAEVADDRMSVTFHLRPEAHFADGTALTADDVVFSFDALKTKGHPLYHQMLEDVVKAEALDPHTVRYTFKGELVRDLPLTVAALPIFSKAYYATARSTRRRSIRRSAQAPTSSTAWRRGAPSSIAATRIIGPRTCRSIAGGGTSTRSASNISATAPPAWRRSRPAPMISARSSPRRSGPPNTIFRRSATAK